MTTAELLAALARECPNGVSFDPLAVRLLRQKVPFEDWQIEDLKATMFQFGSGLWLSSEMVSDDESRMAFRDQAMAWIVDHGCFSVERLLKSFSRVFRHVASPEDCAIFLRHLGFTVAEWGMGGYFCFQPPFRINDSLATISKTITEWLAEADGTLTFHEIELSMPHLTAKALENIRVHFMPEVHEVDVGGVPCWRSEDAISLPEDFSEKLTTILDTLVVLDEKVNAAKLEFALNLFYRIRLREEYDLQDNDTFMRVCAKHYQGENDVFPNMKKSRARTNDLSVPGKRVRSPNTRFCNLGVPIGAKLAFSKDYHITCTVLDASNQVEYGGKAWAISALASHLLGGSAANGFVHFSYEDEILWDRRLRLEREGKQDECQAEKIPLPPEVQEAGNGIIGLDGRVLSPATWRAFRSAGTNPRVSEWAERVKKGERVEQIARESGYAVSTMKNMISNYRLYFKVCQRNGIVPEGGAIV